MPSTFPGADPAGSRRSQTVGRPGITFHSPGSVYLHARDPREPDGCYRPGFWKGGKLGSCALENGIGFASGKPLMIVAHR